jgi:hypothetical protein
MLNSKVLVTILLAHAMHMHGHQGRISELQKESRSRARWGLRTYAGVEEGESLQERCSHMGPSGTQEYSSFAVVEESEVGEQCFILERCCHWGVLLSFDSGGHCEDNQMSAGPLRSKWRRLKVLEENKIPWFNRNCYRALWGVGQDLVCLLSEKFLEEVKIRWIVSQRSRVCWR